MMVCSLEDSDEHALKNNIADANPSRNKALNVI